MVVLTFPGLCITLYQGKISNAKYYQIGVIHTPSSIPSCRPGESLDRNGLAKCLNTSEKNGTSTGTLQSKHVSKLIGLQAALTLPAALKRVERLRNNDQKYIVTKRRVFCLSNSCKVPFHESGLLPVACSNSLTSLLIPHMYFLDTQRFRTPGVAPVFLAVPSG